MGCTTAPVAQAAPLDFGRQTWNILPPGQTGSLPPDAFGTNQLKLYDDLAPLFGDVGPSDIRRLFKSARFFAPAGGEVTRPRRGVTIRRDRSFGVPHIRGRTRSNVFFGIGCATAEDRGLFMETIRYPSRLAIVDAPGLSALRLAMSLRSFEPSAQTERFIRRQRRLIVAKGREGRRVLKDVNAFTAGINAYYRATDNDAKPWTQVDVLSVTGLLGQVFGAGGGDEVRRGLLLSELCRRLGARTGDAVWRDLRSSQDPETSVTTSRRFPYTTERRGRTPGRSSPIRTRWTNRRAGRPALRRRRGAEPRTQCSWAARAPPPAIRSRSWGRSSASTTRSSSSRSTPTAAETRCGPASISTIGIHARGGALPGLPYVLIGRARDYAWSATAAGTDNTDQFLERLCNADGSAPTRASTHYRYRGRCRPMSTFNAGLLGAGDGESAEQVVFRETVHGPVSGTVTVRGRPYAVANLRASRGREAMNASIGSALNEGAIRSGRDFPRVANKLEFTFNLFYVDHRDIAFFSTGRLPVRARGTDPSLPTLGTGRYDWRGFLSRDRRPQAVNPKSGLILNWNNKPAAGFGAADSNWSYQSVHRNDLFKGFKRRNRLHDVLSVVNPAATQDLRAVEVWPVISDVLDGGAAPDARSRQAADLVGAWVRRGASRLDRDLAAKVDHPGAAVLDQVWDALSETVLRPVLGDLAAPGGLFGQLIGRDNSPRRGNGGAYGSGWYGYVEKDLRSLLGRRVRGAYSRRYCGNGDLAACRRSLWAVVKQGADLLAALQGADPSAWRSDATEERIEFQPGVLGPRYTMRWANRPTLHQLMEFRGHRRMGRPRG